MSNSIWKMPDQKPEERRQILFYAGCGGLLNKGWYYTKNDAFGSYSSKNVQKWAYVDELFAQADKAERLEEENEAMREEFEVWHGNHKCVLEDKERLHKAVDLAVLRLEQGKKKFGKSTMGPNKETAMLCEIVIDEIKQLIKGKTDEQEI